MLPFPPGMAEAMADKIDRDILGPELQAQLNEREEIWAAWWQVYGPKVLEEVAAKQAPANLPTGVAEDTYETCTCVAPGGYGEPMATCWHCKGLGYRLTKRIIRPLPAPDFSEQAALAQLKTKDALLLRAAKTLDYNSDILLAAGKRSEAAQTKQAAQAIREAVGEEG